VIVTNFLLLEQQGVLEGIHLQAENLRHQLKPLLIHIDDAVPQGHLQVAQVEDGCEYLVQGGLQLFGELEGVHALDQLFEFDRMGHIVLVVCLEGGRVVRKEKDLL